MVFSPDGAFEISVASIGILLYSMASVVLLLDFWTNLGLGYTSVRSIDTLFEPVVFRTIFNTSGITPPEPEPKSTICDYSCSFNILEFKPASNGATPIIFKRTMMRFVMQLHNQLGNQLKSSNSHSCIRFIKGTRKVAKTMYRVKVKVLATKG